MGEWKQSGEADEEANMGPNSPEFAYRLHHLLAEWSETAHLISLHLLPHL